MGSHRLLFSAASCATALIACNLPVVATPGPESAPKKPSSSQEVVDLTGGNLVVGQAVTAAASLPDNPLTVDPEANPNTRIYLTMIAGRTEYCREGKEKSYP